MKACTHTHTPLWGMLATFDIQSRLGGVGQGLSDRAAARREVGRERKIMD